MHKLLVVILIAGSFTTYADPCPRLQGTFRCRFAEPFELSIVEEMQNGFPSYKLSDPKATRTFVADSLTHEIDLQKGKGQYKAHCEGNSLVLEVHSPSGEVLLDRYYIERAGLVRVRINKANPAASSLSCSPTQGTWKLYPR